jgi:hypothetical protein
LREAERIAEVERMGDFFCVSSDRRMRARDVIARAMRAASSVLLLQTLAEFSNVAIRKAGISVRIFEGQLTLGAPCCRYKRLMTAIFWQPLRL